MAEPVVCKCGKAVRPGGEQVAHVRLESPACRQTRAESRRLWVLRHPERAQHSARERQRRWRQSSKGRDAKIRTEGRRTPEQRRSRIMVQDEIRAGRLITQPCQECGARPAHGHHANGYGPGHELDLTWLCPKHHAAAHVRMRAAKAETDTGG